MARRRSVPNCVVADVFPGRMWSVDNTSEAEDDIDGEGEVMRRRCRTGSKIGRRGLDGVGESLINPGKCGKTISTTSQS